MSSRNLKHLITNTKSKFRSEGKLFCGKNHAGVFSDGTYYYILTSYANK